MATTYTYQLAAYPKELTLRDGTTVVLKPMTEDDTEALLQFFQQVPPDDRYFLKEDVTSPKVLQRWAAELDYNRALPLLAWIDGKIVADGTLHRSRSLARRHVGEVRIVVHPQYRNQGLGTTMLHELALIANEHGIERLLFQVVAEREESAVKAAELVGFIKIAVLPGHAKDRDGRPRDIVLMEMPLGKWLEWSFF
ncbi:MAG TPA: GNAT family protein [Dehalococcoidia bacterium]|nr:GNAT family protein [Dehalococcoidia bacterium]